jgi:hypothetical protein
MAGTVNTVTHISVTQTEEISFPPAQSINQSINHAVTQIFEALHHKQEVRGFDSR